MLFTLIKLSILAGFALMAYKYLAEQPHKVFWLAFLFYLDPGGFFQGYMDSNIFWRIKNYDVFFFLMAGAYFYSSKKYRLIGTLQGELGKIKYWLWFVLLYFIIVYAVVVPTVYGYFNFPMFVQKHRMYLYALPVLIFTYHFTFYSVSFFYRYLVFLSFFILGAYFITLLSGINLVPIIHFSRYGEDSRTAMLSYGLIFWVQPMLIILLTLGRNYLVPYKKILVAAGFLMVVTIVLTLTRREFLRLAFMFLIIPYFISYITRSAALPKITRYVLPLLLLLIFISVFFSEYIDYSTQLFVDLYSTLTTGADTQGNVEYRVEGSGDLLIVVKLIFQHLGFGMGYYPADWGDIMEMKLAGDSLGLALDASSEVPVYGAVMRLGIVGLLIPTLIYYYLIRLLFKVSKFLKYNFTQLKQQPVDLLLMLTLLYLFIAKFTIDAYSLFGEFYLESDFTNFCLMLGLLSGLLKRTGYYISLPAKGKRKSYVVTENK